MMQVRPTMERFDWQVRIPGWDQKRLQDGRIAVCGRDWFGTFVVWALASMGVGEVFWIGKQHPDTYPMASWFLADPCPFAGTRIYEYPFDLEYGPELGWALGGQRIHSLVCCTEDPFAQAICEDYARINTMRFLSGATGKGG
jgi:hypothetical protein